MPSSAPPLPTLSRRAFLRASGALGLGAAAGALVGGRAQASCAGFGALGPADANGLRLPAGFQSRVVATSGQLVSGTAHVWHAAPDGGATFATPGGGWVYVSNSELGGGSGGAGALAFAADGSVVGAYSILSGTSRNCAGGPTPWGTWLSCEEVSDGEVYECDPLAPGSQGVARPALGWFDHEAAAVDPVAGRVYLTEDRSDGRLYRFTPLAYPSLAAGALEAAQVLDSALQGPIAPGQVRPLAWHAVPTPNPGAGGTATRHQAPASTAFNGGEGCWAHGGAVVFTTKGDNRVWRLDPAADTLEILYDLATSPDPELSGVDNVTVSPCGDVYVAEDVGNLEVVALTAGGAVEPVARLVGVGGTEITGPAFSPDGSRLYFSSQRNPGVTFEVSGPFAPPALPGLRAPLAALEAGALAAASFCGRRRAATAGGS